MIVFRHAAALLLACCIAAPAWAGSNSLGQTGLVHMPDGRVQEDGSWLFGVTRMDPYSAVWSSIAILPRLELSARFTFVDDVEAFTEFGLSRTFRDKALDAKLVLLREDAWLPSLSVGVQDPSGTGLFSARFVAASKRVGDFDFTLGWGRQRIDGAFGGVRWDLPWSERVSLLAEWDAIDYPNDFHARRSGEIVREGGLTLGLEYRRGWVTTQVAQQDGTWGINAYLSVPLQRRTFAAKTAEPAHVEVDIEQRPAIEDWQNTPVALKPLH